MIVIKRFPNDEIKTFLKTIYNQTYIYIYKIKYTVNRK